MNTKKDYIRAANLCAMTEKKFRKAVVIAFVEFFRVDNPSFQQETFISAADPSRQVFK